MAGDLKRFLFEEKESRRRFQLNLNDIIKKYDREFENSEIDLPNLSLRITKGDHVLRKKSPLFFGHTKIIHTKREEERKKQNGSICDKNNCSSSNYFAFGNSSKLNSSGNSFHSEEESREGSPVSTDYSAVSHGAGISGETFSLAEQNSAENTDELLTLEETMRTFIADNDEDPSDAETISSSSTFGSEPSEDGVCYLSDSSQDRDSDCGPTSFASLYQRTTSNRKGDIGYTTKAAREEKPAVNRNQSDVMTLITSPSRCRKDLPVYKGQRSSRGLEWEPQTAATRISLLENGTRKTSPNTEEKFHDNRNNSWSPRYTHKQQERIYTSFNENGVADTRYNVCKEPAYRSSTDNVILFDQSRHCSKEDKSRNVEMRHFLHGENSDRIQLNPISSRNKGVCQVKDQSCQQSAVEFHKENSRNIISTWTRLKQEKDIPDNKRHVDKQQAKRIAPFYLGKLNQDFASYSNKEIEQCRETNSVDEKEMFYYKQMSNDMPNSLNLRHGYYDSNSRCKQKPVIAAQSEGRRVLNEPSVSERGVASNLYQRNTSEKTKPVSCTSRHEQPAFLNYQNYQPAEGDSDCHRIENSPSSNYENRNQLDMTRNMSPPIINEENRGQEIGYNVDEYRGRDNAGNNQHPPDVITNGLQSSGSPFRSSYYIDDEYKDICKSAPAKIVHELKDVNNDISKYTENPLSSYDKVYSWLSPTTRDSKDRFKVRARRKLHLAAPLSSHGQEMMSTKTIADRITHLSSPEMFDKYRKSWLSQRASPKLGHPYSRTDPNSPSAVFSRMKLNSPSSALGKFFGNNCSENDDTMVSNSTSMFQQGDRHYDSITRNTSAQQMTSGQWSDIPIQKPSDRHTTADDSVKMHLEKKIVSSNSLQPKKLSNGMQSRKSFTFSDLRKPSVNSLQKRQLINQDSSVTSVDLPLPKSYSNLYAVEKDMRSGSHVTRERAQVESPLEFSTRSDGQKCRNTFKEKLPSQKFCTGDSYNMKAFVLSGRPNKQMYNTGSYEPTHENTCYPSSHNYLDNTSQTDVLINEPLQAQQPYFSPDSPQEHYLGKYSPRKLSTRKDSRFLSPLRRNCSSWSPRRKLTEGYSPNVSMVTVSSQAKNKTDTDSISQLSNMEDNWKKVPTPIRKIDSVNKELKSRALSVTKISTNRNDPNALQRSRQHGTVSNKILTGSSKPGKGFTGKQVHSTPMKPSPVFTMYDSFSTINGGKMSDENVSESDSSEDSVITIDY